MVHGKKFQVLFASCSIKTPQQTRTKGMNHPAAEAIEICLIHNKKT